MKLSDKIEVCADQIENCIEIECLDSKQLRLILGQFAESVNENCNLQNVSGMFSAADVEKSYKDGVNDAITKGYGTFDIENYR